MNKQDCYHLCHQYNGKIVHIRDIEGSYHVGRITKITDNSVWIEPVSKRPYNGGFGYGPRYSDEDYYGYDNTRYDGYGYDYNGEFGLELAFGFIVGITLAALFFF
ncbi:hypothetical protein [Ectobacillus sp. sgz5001026]|uniref:hypothetical protein n=1 Tax=Ectobacillus sp. sgz5001026 TaxID=3242473 RepID=UPI0036D20B37